MSELPNRLEPMPGVVSAGQPDAAALEELADAGFAAVVDIRGADEPRGFDEKACVEALRMRYVALPVTGPADLSFETATALDEVLTEARGRPVLVHCGSGNRVGALLALLEGVRGRPAEDALALGVAGGMTSPALHAIVAERLANR
jgi:uncharacterized protein (TIGR01244 family)